MGTGRVDRQRSQEGGVEEGEWGVEGVDIHGKEEWGGEGVKEVGKEKSGVGRERRGKNVGWEELRKRGVEHRSGGGGGVEEVGKEKSGVGREIRGKNVGMGGVEKEEWSGGWKEWERR